jgi:PKD repeat protein
MKHLIRWAAMGLALALLLAVGGCKLFNSPPVANFSWAPSDPIARADVQFSDDSTDEGGMFGGGGIVAWDWDFGDSDSSSSRDPEHAYGKSGTYTVRLTVTDGSGDTATKSKTITVSPSLDGTWRGTWDSCANFFDLTLELNQSATGGIGGIMYIAVQAFPLNGATLAGSQVSISLLNGLILQGTLSADERSMSGQWSFQGNTGCTWSVSLQG